MSSKSNTSPPIALRDILDLESLQELCSSFSNLTGLATAILDIKGEILVNSGWQRVCLQFHRKNPGTAQRCLESDTVLAGQLAEGKRYNLYRCKNGLVDAAVPILIDGMHLGNLFTGQFFLEPPAMETFARQAEQFGFEQSDYLAALAEVPVYSSQKVHQAMEFLTNLTEIIGKNGLDKLQLHELNKTLEEQVQKRTADLHLSKRFSDSLINSLPGIMYLFDEDGTFIRWNGNLETVTGYSPQQIQQMSPLDFIAAANKEEVKATYAQLQQKEDTTLEANILIADGRTIPYLLTGFKFKNDNESYLVGVGLDISTRIQNEQERERLIGKLQESLAMVKQLSGFLPICASCKKIRDDEGYWNQIEAYIESHSEAEFSHSLCPECVKKLYPDLEEEQ